MQESASGAPLAHLWRTSGAPYAHLWHASGSKGTWPPWQAAEWRRLATDMLKDKKKDK